MSRKQRALTCLHTLESELLQSSKTDFKEASVALMRDIAITKTICLQGLPLNNCAAYEKIFDKMLLSSKEMAENEEIKIKKHAFSKCFESLQRLIHKAERETKFKKDIVFLPYQASMWDSLESVWKSACADKEHCNAYVIPIPYAELNPDRSVAKWHCERECFPKYVPTLDWKEIDLKAFNPDVIFFHNPYDESNLVTSVESRYYSYNLKSCADELVYIPYFILEEPCMEEGIAHFVTLPGVLNADKVIVQSESMKELYIDVLVKKTNQPDRTYWEKRILGIGSPKIDKVLTSEKADFEMPEEWLELIQGKKVILYNTSVHKVISHPDKILDKLRYVFDYFRKTDDFILWWRPHPLMQSTFHSMRPQFEEEFLALKNEYIEKKWGIYDDTSDLHRAICYSDAYYGDRSSVLDLYKYTKKPIMIEDVLEL